VRVADDRRPAISDDVNRTRVSRVLDILDIDRPAQH
jgi:hypothetical protein